jgi:hypothetical protein
VKSKKITFGQKKKYMSGGSEMKVKANIDFSVTLVNGETFKINKGDTFNLVATFIALPSKTTMAVVHKKHTAPFGCYLDNFDLVE